MVVRRIQYLFFVFCVCPFGQAWAASDTGQSNLSTEPDPRIQYRSFFPPGDPWRDGSDIEDWDRGWREYGMGVIFSLRHDPGLPPTRSDPYLP